MSKDVHAQSKSKIDYKGEKLLNKISTILKIKSIDLFDEYEKYLTKFNLHKYDALSLSLNSKILTEIHVPMILCFIIENHSEIYKEIIALVKPETLNFSLSLLHSSINDKVQKIINSIEEVVA